MSMFSLRGSYRIAGNVEGGMSSSNEFQVTILQFIKRHLKHGARVLDLGAGAGLFSELLEKNGYDVVSADLFPKKCSRPCLHVDLNAAFADQIGERFDAISCLEVIEHIENPRALLRECTKLLKPGGLLFISTPDASGLYSRIRFFLTGEFAMFSDEAYRSIGHITPISYWQMTKMLEENEVEIIEQVDYDGSSSVPHTLGDLMKIMLRVLRPMLAGHVGWQVMAFACRRNCA